jgi:hypothetical protein
LPFWPIRSVRCPEEDGLGSDETFSLFPETAWLLDQICRTNPYVAEFRYIKITEIPDSRLSRLCGINSSN